MTYDEVVAALMTLNEIPLNQTDENFQRIIPAMFLYADGMIYRDLALIVTEITQPMSLVARVRQFALPPSVRSLRAINVCTPATPSVMTTSKRVPLERIPPEVLDFFWPQESFRPGMPQKYAVVGGFAPAIVPPPPGPQPQMLQQFVRLMPAPDQPYPIELLGDIRPDPLSPDNPQTYLSVTYPELFICACMIFAAGYQRDFGAQADDPQRAASWQGIYGAVRAGASLEQARARAEGPGWTAAVPAPAAQPRAP